MIVDLKSLDLYVLIGLMVTLSLLGGALMIGTSRRQKQIGDQLKEQEMKAKELQRKEKQQEEERINRIKDSIINSDWIYCVADYVLQAEAPVNRIEIWKNQLIVEGETFNLEPLSIFGAKEELTSEEMYHANKILYEILCRRGCLQFGLRNRFAYCEIIKIY